MLTSAGCEYTGARGYTCSLTGCSNRELTEIICDKCQQVFCLRFVTHESFPLLSWKIEQVGSIMFLSDCKIFKRRATVRTISCQPTIFSPFYKKFCD
jgi:hypothetical protein